LAKGGGEWGKPKRRGRGFRFLAYQQQGLTVVAGFGQRRGRRRLFFSSVERRWSSDGKAVKRGQADATRREETAA